MPSRLNRTLLSLAVAVLPQLASAELPFTAQSMAHLQATIDFCGRSAPKEAEQFQEQVKQLVRSLPAKEVSTLMESDDYKSTYEAISSALGQLGPHDADDTCQRLLHPKQ